MDASGNEDRLIMCRVIVHESSDIAQAIALASRRCCSNHIIIGAITNISLLVRTYYTINIFKHDTSSTINRIAFNM